MFKKGNLKEKLILFSVILIIVIAIVGFVSLICSFFFKPNSNNIIVSNTDSSANIEQSLSSDTTSSRTFYSLDDIYDVEGNYIPEADNSPVVSFDANEDFEISSDVERYIIDKESNKIFWQKKVTFDSDKFKDTSMFVSIIYNYSARDVNISIIAPDGSLYQSSDYEDNIVYTGSANLCWEIENAENGEYTVEITGRNIYEYEVMLV